MHPMVFDGWDDGTTSTPVSQLRRRGRRAATAWAGVVAVLVVATALAAVVWRSQSGSDGAGGADANAGGRTAGDAGSAVVTRVVDGDTIAVRIGHTNDKVRL